MLRDERSTVASVATRVGYHSDVAFAAAFKREVGTAPGAYRRALSSYDVKLHAVPTLSRALDEPSAYEVVEPGADLNVDIPRA